jgi:hypothetical protein
MERLVNPQALGLDVPDGERVTEARAIEMLKARAEAAEADNARLRAGFDASETELAALRAQLETIAYMLEPHAQLDADGIIAAIRGLAVDLDDCTDKLDGQAKDGE